MVQAGVNPFHPAAAAFPQPTAHTAESLSAAVAAKSEQIAAAHKDASGGGPPNQIPGSQVNEHFFHTFFLFFFLHTLEMHILFIQQLRVSGAVKSRTNFMNIQVMGWVVTRLLFILLSGSK